MSTPEPKRETVTSTQNTEPWASQKPYLEQGFKEAQGIYNQGPQQFYGGQTFAPTDAATTAGLNAGEAEANATLRGDYIDPSKNAGLRNLIDATMARTVPGATSPFIAAGRSGSGLAARALGEGVAAGVAPLYQAERDRMLQAPGLLGQIGAQREAISQRPIDEAIARHDYTQMAPSESLARYMQMIQGNYGGQSTGTTQQLIPQANPWMQALGITANVAGTAAKAFMSDVRLKEDIKRVGETDGGLPIYTYRYKWEGKELPKRMGVMAQDVLKKKPEAVAAIKLGKVPYLAVDYSQVN